MSCSDGLDYDTRKKVLAISRTITLLKWKLKYCTKVKANDSLKLDIQNKIDYLVQEKINVLITSRNWRNKKTIKNYIGRNVGALT